MLVIIGISAVGPCFNRKRRKKSDDALSQEETSGAGETESESETWKI